MILRCEKCETMYMFTEAQLKNQNYKFTCKKCGHENSVALPSDTDLHDHSEEQGLPPEQEQPVIPDELAVHSDAPADQPAGEPPAPKEEEPAQHKSADLDDIFSTLGSQKAEDKGPGEKAPADKETLPDFDFSSPGISGEDTAPDAGGIPDAEMPVEGGREQVNKETDVIEGFEEFTMDDVKADAGPSGETGTGGTGEKEETTDTSWLESTSIQESPADKKQAAPADDVMPLEPLEMQEEMPEHTDTPAAAPRPAAEKPSEESSLLQESSVAVPELTPVPRETAAAQKSPALKKHVSRLVIAPIAGVVIVLAVLIGMYYYFVEYAPGNPDFKKLTYMSYSVIPASSQAKARALQLLNEADKEYLKGTISGYESSLVLYEQAVAADHHLVGAYTGIAKDFAVLKDRNSLQNQLRNSGKFLKRLKDVLHDDAQYSLVEGMVALANNDYEKASGDITAALRKPPVLPEALYYKAYIDYKQGEFLTQAASLLTQAVALEPEMVKASILLAEIYRKQDPSQALGILDSILARYPSNIAAAVLRARIEAEGPSGTTQAIADLTAVAAKYGATIDAYDKASLYEAIGTLNTEGKDYPAAIAAFTTSIQDNPSAGAYIGLGDAYLDSGSLDQAEQQYKSALAIDRSSIEANLKLGQAYYLDKKYVLAISAYNECLRLDAKNTAALYGMALAREGNGELDTALRTVQTAVQLSPGNPSFLTLNGRLLRKKKEYKDAAALLLSGVTQFPAYAPLHTEFAVVLSKEGDYPGALQQLNTAMTISPASATNNAYMADILNKESKYAQAEAYARKALAIDPHQPYAYEVLGDIYFNEKKYDDAVRSYNESIAIKPYEARVFYKLAMVYGAGSRFTLAVNALNNAIKINPTDAQYHYELGTAYRSLGNIQFAINEYTRAIDLDSTLADAYYQRGLINIEGKNDIAAVNDLKNAMKYAPDNPDYMLALSNYYYKNKETYAAIEYLTSALKIAPKNPEIHYRLGVADNYIGKVEDAKKEFRTALSLSPRYAQALVGLGTIAYQNGDMKTASQYYEKAVQLAPDDGDAYYALGTVDEYNGMYEKALTAYQYAVKYSKNPAAAYFKEGMMLSNLNEPDKAKAALLKAISLGLSSDMETMAKNKLQNLM